MRLLLPLAASLAAALLLPIAPAQAARSFDNCTGYVDSLPATISTQGTWCLRANRTAALTSGAAITIATNNVTLDCNDFHVQDTQVGNVQANGIAAKDRQGITVRNCLVIGFLRGVALTGNGSGHTVEDNRLHRNTLTGIAVDGDGSLVRRNEVLDTGNTDVLALADNAYGIRVSGDVDVLDNTIDGVMAATAPTQSYGVSTLDSAGTVAGNRIHGASRGVRDVGSTRLIVRDNRISGGQVGITCDNGGPHARRNMFIALPVRVVTCMSTDNVIVP